MDLKIKAKNAEKVRSISKFIQKNGKECKKRAEMPKKQKMHFHLKIHAKRANRHFQFRNALKKSKHRKKKTHLFEFYGFYIPVHGLHFKPNNSYKKRQNANKG